MSLMTEMYRLPKQPPINKITKHFVYPCLIGVEVEIENQEPEQVDGWEVKPDNSLRNGVEFVLGKPKSCQNLLLHLQRLRTKVADTAGKFSWRTSIHIHMDIRDLTTKQLSNLIYTYVLMEDVLFAMVNPVRKASPFCMPVSSSRHNLDVFGNIAKVLRAWELGNDVPRPNFNGLNKYTAMNLLPMRELGSVEFRHMHGTLTNELDEWINALLRLKEFAVTTDFDDSRLLELWSGLGTQGLMEAVFKDNAQMISAKNGDELENNLSRGMRSLQYLLISDNLNNAQAKLTPVGDSLIHKQAHKELDEQLAVAVNLRPEPEGQDLADLGIPDFIRVQLEREREILAAQRAQQEVQFHAQILRGAR